MARTSDPRYGTQRWRRTRRRVLDRAGWRCESPGCNADLRGHRAGFADHVWEVNDGGPFWLEDGAEIQALCWNHHQAKTFRNRADRDNSGPQSPNA